jgi:hypothetical protein
MYFISIYAFYKYKITIWNNIICILFHANCKIISQREYSVTLQLLDHKNVILQCISILSTLLCLFTLSASVSIAHLILTISALILFDDYMCLLWRVCKYILHKYNLKDGWCCCIYRWIEEEDLKIWFYPKCQLLLLFC